MIGYHTVGLGQYLGTCKYHVYKDCFHLHKKRMMGPLDMTGKIEQCQMPEGTTNICKLCLNRKKPF